MNQKIKEGSFIAPNASLPETLAASLAIGGGGFATMRLLQEMMNQGKAKSSPGDDNALNIDLPKTMMPAYMAHLPGQQGQKIPGAQTIQDQQMSLKHAGDGLNKALAIGGGVPLGFMGAKVLYDKYKEYQMKQELGLVNKRYMQAMTDFNNPDVSPAQLGQIPQPQQSVGQQIPKMANEETLAVDAFCEKLAEEYNKIAGPFGDMAEGGGHLLSSMIGQHDPHHDAMVQMNGEIMGEQALKNLPHNLALGTGMDSILGNALLGSGLLVGGSAFAGMAMANKNRQEAEKKRQFPSSVEINYAQ